MAKTRGGLHFKPRIRPSSLPPTDVAAVPASAVAPSTAASPANFAAPSIGQSSPPAVAPAASQAPIPVAPAPHRYDTWVRPTPPHSWPSHRAPPPKRARTSSPGDSSSLRPQEPHSPPIQGPVNEFSSDLSPASIIRRPVFHYGPITGNSDCSTREVHSETYYDFPTFAANPKLRDSMRLVQWYSLKPFMTPRRFFYPRVVIKFYHTMTSRQVPYPTAIHFSIDGCEGTLRAVDIAATFNFPIVLANSADYKLWPHPSAREMVRLLSRGAAAGSIFFRRQLPPSMLLIDHILRSNLFPLQHIVQQQGAILEALYRISEGFWFSLTELFMTSLFYFEDKVHRKNLTRVESIPLLFPRLLCQVLEHMGFPAEPQLERRRDCKAILTFDRWQLLPHAQYLLTQDIVEDIAVDYPAEDTKEPQIALSAAPTVTAPLPTSSASSAPPMPPAPAASVGPSTSAPPP